MLQIPRKVEYALRAAVFLARQPDGENVSFREVADAQDVPPDFMAKILRTLVENGLLASSRGANGGYRLAQPASKVTFLDVIEAADSPITLNVCCDQGEGCQLSDTCSMRDIWQRGEDAMKAVFRDVRLSDLACRSELLHIFGPFREAAAT
jgi:Rrf2 family protein